MANFPTKPLTRPEAPPRPAEMTWAAVLSSVGYPTDVFVLDFETYFDADYSMKKISTIEYVTDKRFEILGLGYLHMMPGRENYDHACCLSRDKLTFIVNGTDFEKVTVVMQNARFDAMILAKHFGVYPPFIIDTLSLARAWNSRKKNDLDSLCKEFKLPAKGNTEDFAGLSFRRRVKKQLKRGKGPKMPEILPSMTEDQAAALGDYCRNDVMREWEVFTRLLPKLSNPATELRLAKHTLDLWLRPVLQVDREYGADLIQKMGDQIVTALGPYTTEEISGNKTFERLLTTALKAAGDDPRKYYKPCKKGEMLGLAKADESLERLKEHADEGVRNLIAARMAVKSRPLHIARVQRIMRMAEVNGGPLPVPLKYHGAHTGRWSGGEKINLQNLGTRGDPLIAAVRGMIVAPPGHSLVIVDASQIEARVLAWIAGQWDLVEKFTNGEEIYCGFASRVLNIPVRKPRADDPDAVKQRLLWARNSIGKVGILGCGYGMGAAKAVGYAQGNIDLPTAERIVNQYRDENREITKFWREIERAFVYTAKFNRPNMMDRGLRFYSTKECDVIIVLPNDREIHYHHVQLEPGMRGDSIRVWSDVEHGWEYAWGGGLTENVVQAMSRDILAEAMLRLEDGSYHTALHIHDELVLCVPDDRADYSLRVAINELSARPVWASECPLGAGGTIAKRYGSH